MGVEITPEIQADIDRLKAALPPIFTDYKTLFALPFADERVIDLEWHRADTDDDDEPRCGCGRDLPDGALETIGIGNDRAVLQIDWQALNDYERVEVRADVEKLVSTGVTIYHNAPADIEKMRENRFDITAAGHARLEDTMLADAVTDSEEAHDLGDLNRRHGRLPGYKHLQRVAPVEYNAGDLVGTYVIWKHGLAQRFATDPAAFFIYRTLSIPFLDLQIEGDEAGVRVNAPVAWKLLDKYDGKVKQARMLALAYTGDPTFNLGSPDKVKHWLYNVYGLPIQREKAYGGDEGKVTTDKDALAVLRRKFGTEWDEGEEPTLEQALENIDEGGHGLLEAKYLFGGAQQRLTHYVLPCLHVEGEGDKRKVLGPRERIYPQCRQHVQASGRHSYVKPALQQMRGDTAELITPDPGTVWIGWDWSQIEVRLLAVLAGDEPYLQAFARGDDIHEINVRTFFPEKGNKELENLRRRWGKAFVFRLHYRGKPENAGDIPGTRALNLDVDLLVGASSVYLDRHAAIPEFWRAVETEADRSRMARTFMGRPRRLTSPYRNARNREASNHPMQGGVADIYVQTALLIKAAAPWARLVYGAHDAQWWQIPVARELEFVTIIAPIVLREFEINGRRVHFPAEFKRKEAA